MPGPDEEPNIPRRQIRAVFDERTIRVYQVYSHVIADSALQHGRFVSPPFSMTRMTWIKPSFLWMMYRAGWGEKDDGQRRILALDIRRDGFEWALSQACLSHYDPDFHPSHAAWQVALQASLVRIQWDPERDFHFRALNHRSLQIGLRDDAVRRYVEEWVVAITDITADCTLVNAAVQAGDLVGAQQMLPAERPYPLKTELSERLRAE